MVLVSICIPTFNRVEHLGRSVASALGQSHRDVEVVVSDNASTDGTDEWLATLGATEPRLRVFTTPANVGPTANFALAQSAAVGSYVMWLGDDDWLDEHFVAKCLDLLLADPASVHAAGHVRYHAADGREWDSAPAPLVQPKPASRVMAYYRSVTDNGVFYGLTRASALKGIRPMRAVMGSDWYHMAGLAMRGTILIDPTVLVHRSVGGATSSLANAAQIGGYPSWHALLPQPAIVVGAVRHILNEPAASDVLASPQRAWLAARVGGLLTARLLPHAASRFAERVGAWLVRRWHRATGP